SARGISLAATARRWSRCHSRARPRSSTWIRRRHSWVSRSRSKRHSRSEPGASAGGGEAAGGSLSGTAPKEGAHRNRTIALASPQREELGVDDVVGAGEPARAEPGRKASPRRGLRRCQHQHRSGNDKCRENPPHHVLLRVLPYLPVRFIWQK